MVNTKELNYIVKTQADLNLSYLSFIINGGFFIPTLQLFELGEIITLNLQLPAQTQALIIETKVIWITPKNALYHTLPGIGLQFIGPTAKALREQIKAKLDSTMEVGGYI